jgi:FtsH-binding integral membrane protein
MIPGLQDIYNNNSARLPKFSTLGDLLSGVINIIFYAAAFVAFFYILWGAFAYISAQGKKEDLAKARARITWAIIGLIVVFLAYIITKLVAGVFAPQGGLPF